MSFFHCQCVAQRAWLWHPPRFDHQAAPRSSSLHLLVMEFRRSKVISPSIFTFGDCLNFRRSHPPFFLHVPFLSLPSASPICHALLETDTFVFFHHVRQTFVRRGSFSVMEFRGADPPFSIFYPPPSEHSSPPYFLHVDSRGTPCFALFVKF